MAYSDAAFSERFTFANVTVAAQFLLGRAGGTWLYSTTIGFGIDSHGRNG